MAGIEPASERFDPRISTSVVKLFDLACEDAHLRCFPPASRLDPKVLFSGVNGVAPGHTRIVTPDSIPAGERDGQTRSHVEIGRTSLTAIRQLKEVQRRKCDWHLIFCADFTRSAPLGSQSGTSLSRRSLSSPVN